MKKNILISLALLLVFIFTGCKSITTEKKTSLLKVERTGDYNNKYGEIEIREDVVINFINVTNSSTVKNNEIKIPDNKKNGEESSLEFEDEIVKMNFCFLDDRIKLIIENKGDNLIKIDWDSSVFICADSFSMSIINKDYKWGLYTEKTGGEKWTRLKDVIYKQTPTIIKEKEKIYDYILPKWNVYYGSGLTIRKLIGVDKANFGLLLALEINGEPYEYLSSFYYEEIKIEKKSETKSETETNN